MSKTYKYLSLLSNGIRFANNAKITDTLTFTGSMVRIPGSAKGKTLQTVQNTIALNVPFSVLPEGCTDQCSAVSVMGSVRVTFSAPASVEADTKQMWLDLKAIVDEAIATDKILAGFKPSANNVFTVGN